MIKKIAAALFVIIILAIASIALAHTKEEVELLLQSGNEDQLIAELEKELGVTVAELARQFGTSEAIARATLIELAREGYALESKKTSSPSLNTSNSELAQELSDIYGDSPDTQAYVSPAPVDYSTVPSSKKSPKEIIGKILIGTVLAGFGLAFWLRSRQGNRRRR